MVVEKDTLPIPYGRGKFDNEEKIECKVHAIMKLMKKIDCTSNG